MNFAIDKKLRIDFTGLAHEVIDGHRQRSLLVNLKAAMGMHRHTQFPTAKLSVCTHILLPLMDFSAAITDKDSALRESEERFRTSFARAAVGLAHLTPDGHFIEVNKKLTEILGFADEEFPNLSYKKICHPDDYDADIELTQDSIGKGKDDCSVETRYISKDGHTIWARRSTSLVRNSAGKALYFVVVIEEISGRMEIEEKLLRLATHDVLTGLPNRVLLQDRLSQAVVYAQRGGRHIAVLSIDLDRFKNINDSLGHDAGNTVIVEMGIRLSSCIREGDTVSRVGGDEFVVVLSDVAREAEVARLAQKIMESLFRPMTMMGQEFYPTGSVGISLYPKDGQDGESLLRNADIAMHRAKDAGRDNFQFYTHEMNARILARWELEGKLRHVLIRKELVLHYQPQVDSMSGTLVGIEALVRLQPTIGPMIFPNDFIPLAEETGMIVSIGEWVLRTACSKCMAWQALGYAPIKVAVNLSGRQFRHPGLEKMVANILLETGFDAKWLVLEITESVIMENPDAAVETLFRLSRMGIQLSIDDFGTGYSSLSYLKRFPVDILKLDQSFVCEITTDTNDAAIAKAVIALAHSMKLKVVAEGVETVGQLEFLRSHRCDQLQGYFIGRPLPAEQTEKLLNRAKL